MKYDLNVGIEIMFYKRKDFSNFFVISLLTDWFFSFY